MGESKLLRHTPIRMGLFVSVHDSVHQAVGLRHLEAVDLPCPCRRDAPEHVCRKGEPLYTRVIHVLHIPL